MFTNDVLTYLDPDYKTPLQCERRIVTYNDSCDKDGKHSVRIVEDYPEDGYKGRLADTIYLDETRDSTDWGLSADVPSHWDGVQIEKFLEIRADGYSLSEKLYDRCLQSKVNNFDMFVDVASTYLKAKNESLQEKPEIKLDAEIQHIIDMTLKLEHIKSQKDLLQEKQDIMKRAVSKSGVQYIRQNHHGYANLHEASEALEKMKLGKTGDSKTGKITPEQRKVAEVQTAIAKEFMLKHHKEKGE